MDQLSLLNEDKLLIYCSRVSMDEDIKIKLKEILGNPLDWDYILDCSIKQGASQLLYWNLSKIGNGKVVPYNVMKNLEKMYYSNLARNMVLYDELSKVLKAFKKADIGVIVMKGAFLAEKLYKNIALRSMSDIDLLIKVKDLEKAKKELNELMYFPTIVFPTKFHEKLLTTMYEELPFINEAKNILVEIHWDIQPPISNYKVDINTFWNNAQLVKIADVETLTFSPEDTLQHFCLHLDKHLNLNTAPPGRPCRDYCDIAEVTRYYNETINWTYLLESSKKYGIGKPVFQCLYVANKYFGAFVPENIFNKLESDKPTIDFQEIFKGAMENFSKKGNQCSKINYISNLKLLNRTSEKIYFLIREVFPSKEYMLYRYSIEDKKQVNRYYLVRLGAAFLWGLDFLHKLPLFLLKLAFSR